MEARRENNNNNRQMSFTSVASSPSLLPLAPTSFHVWKNKPYFMNQNQAVGGSGSRKNQISSTFLQHFPVTSSATSQLQVSDPFAADLEYARARMTRTLDPNMDPRKLRRIISNRLSAQRSRLKKLQYVTDMENKVKTLEAQIAFLSPQIAVFRNQQLRLQMEQKNLKQRMVACANDRIVKEAEIEKKKAEVYKLRELQLRQQQQNVQAQMRMQQGSVWGGLVNYPMVKNQGGQSGGTIAGECNNQLIMGMNQQLAKPNNFVNGDWDCGMTQMNLSWNQPVEPVNLVTDSSFRGLGGIEEIISNRNPSTSNNVACS